MRWVIVVSLVAASEFLVVASAQAQTFGQRWFWNGVQVEDQASGYVCSELSNDPDNVNAVRGPDPWSGRESFRMRFGPYFANAVFMAEVLPEPSSGNMYVDLDLGGGTRAPVFMGALNGEGYAEVGILGGDRFGSNDLAVTFIPSAFFIPLPPMLVRVRHFGLDPRTAFEVAEPDPWVFPPIFASGMTFHRTGPEHPARYTPVSGALSMDVIWSIPLPGDRDDIEFTFWHVMTVAIDFHNGEAESQFLMNGRPIHALFGAETEIVRVSCSGRIPPAAPAVADIVVEWGVYADHNILGYRGGILWDDVDEVTPAVPLEADPIRWGGFDAYDGQTATNLLPGLVDPAAIASVRIPLRPNEQLFRIDYYSKVGAYLIEHTGHGRVQVSFTGSRLGILVHPVFPFTAP